MEIKENTDLNIALKNFTDTFCEAVGPIIDGIINIVKNLSMAFLEAWEETKSSMSFFDNTISRKRFIKLLMSGGYQRNEAKKIAWETHSKKGRYTILDYMVKVKEMEDRKCG